MRQKKQPKDMNQLAKFIADSINNGDNKVPKETAKIAPGAKLKAKKK